MDRNNGDGALPGRHARNLHLLPWPAGQSAGGDGTTESMVDFRRERAT
jgi:hypothetical protein